MKKNTLMLALSVFMSVVLLPAFSQDTAKVKKAITKLEQLAEKEGSVIKKEFTELGRAGSVTVSFVKVTDVNASTQVKGIKFSKSFSIGYSSYERTSFLDEDEINGLLAFLDFAKSVADKPETYTEYQYKSKGDFSASTFTASQYSGKLTGEWKTVITVDNSYNNSSELLSKKEFDSFVGFVHKGKDLVSQQY